VKLLHSVPPRTAVWARVNDVDLFLCRGDSLHPLAVITAGVHGDEYEGPAAALLLTGQLKPAGLAGSLVIVPVAHPAAFAADSRTSPIDGLNLARTFPGRSDGSSTEQLAAWLFDEVVTGSDYLIDLHSGGIEYRFLPMIGFYGEPASGNKSFQSAEHFGLPLLWQLPDTAGVLSREAWARGIVAIGAEYHGAGQLAASGAEAYVAGVRSCLAYWSVLADTGSLAPGGDKITGDWQLASAEGLFQARCDLGQEVQPGDVVAEIMDMRGRAVQCFTAEKSTLVAGLRSKAHIRPGNWGVFLGIREIR
jgi:predicted deacylase